jgi:tripartite-type tricarboxylate transporter receptor subunit TctC
MTPAKIAPLAVYLLSATRAKDVSAQIFAVRNNEIFLMSQPRPLRSVHRGEGWTPQTIAEHCMPALKASFVRPTCSAGPHRPTCSPAGTPGGATDTLGRTLAQKLQESWGQNVIVENRAGAAGTIGNNLVAKAPADGYTVLIAITALVQQASLMDKLPYDPLKDFTPVTMIARSPSMLAVPLASPARSLKDFVAMVKAQPGKHNFGSYGAGTSSHIQGALLNMQAGLDLVHVPFQGAAPLVTNLVGGQLSAAFIDSTCGRSSHGNRT